MDRFSSVPIRGLYRVPPASGLGTRIGRLKRVLAKNPARFLRRLAFSGGKSRISVVFLLGDVSGGVTWHGAIAGIQYLVVCERRVQSVAPAEGGSGCDREWM